MNLFTRTKWQKMADNPITQYDRIVIEGADGTDMAVRSVGMIGAYGHAGFMREGKKLYYISENFNLAASGTEARAFLIRNPNGSGKIIRLTDLQVILTNTVGAIAIVRMYHGPTITANGTALTIRNASHGGSPGATGMNAYSGPTISANGTRILSGTITSGTSGGRDLILPFDGSIAIHPNNNLLITGQPDGTNRAMELTLRWSEEA